MLKRHSIFGRLLVVMFIMAIIVVFLFIAVYTIAVRQGIGSTAAIFHYSMVGGLFILLALTHVISYRVLKKLILPIKQLNQAALEISTGNFEVEVPVTSTDELGELTKTFNNMTTEIWEMIEVRERMLRDISHEFKTPLTRMKLALEMLKNEPLRESMQEDVQELEDLTNEILETEKLRKGILTENITKTDFVTVLREVTDGFQGQSPSIVFKQMPVMQELQIDRKAVKKALKNVFENAIKYSKTDSKPIDINAQIEGSQFVVRVMDDGIGIPEKELSRVFKPFYRVDQSRSKGDGKTGGYGLGLNLAKKIMEAHQGKLMLENNELGGVTASFWFPME